MFNIKLVDIGGDGLVTEFNSPLDTLTEVEVLVTDTISQALGVWGISLVYDDELVYSVWMNGHEIGIVAIKDVNPLPIKRK